MCCILVVRALQPRHKLWVTRHIFRLTTGSPLKIEIFRTDGRSETYGSTALYPQSRAATPDDTIANRMVASLLHVITHNHCFLQSYEVNPGVAT